MARSREKQFPKPIDAQLVATSFETLKTCIAEAMTRLGSPDKTCVMYRGQKNAEWHLQCSLVRNASKWLPKCTLDNLRTLEADIYYHFLTRMSRAIGPDHSGWDYLYHMQHHDLPTRLLDWSISAAHALWFAVQTSAGNDANDGADQPSPALWVLNGARLNKLSWEYEDLVDPEYLVKGDCTYKDYVANSYEFEFDMPVAVTPIPVNDRMVAQRGHFTIFGNDIEPLDLQAPTCVEKVVLTATCVDEVREMLTFFDVNEYSMRPDVTGLERYLRGIYSEKVMRSRKKTGVIGKRPSLSPKGK